MTKTTLRIVTLKTVANYRRVAEHAVGAYRASGHRLLAMVRRNLDRSTDRIAPRLFAALRQTSAKVNEVAAKGIDSVSAQTERVIELGTAGVNARIDRIADLVESVENRYVATGLQTAARFSLTGAQAALTVSETLAAGADKLADIVGGKHARGTKAVAHAKTAVRAARRATAPAKPAVAKAIQPRAKKLVKTVVERTRAAPAKRAARPVVRAKVSRHAAPKVQQPVATA
jgi:hypothetical protein